MVVQSAIMTWARETAAMSLREAAHELGLNENTGTEKLAEIEAGAREPSRPLLLKMAKAYRRPLITFYLAEPPRIGDRGLDFRTLPGKVKDRPEVDALVRDIKARQGLIRSMLEDDEAPQLEFVGSATTKVPTKELADRIAKHLKFSLSEFRAKKDVSEAFAYLRLRIEDTGVFLPLVGNLGSYHTNISVDLFRGFALADPLAPLIVINDQDARAAWSFTAVHELAHLWLGDTGISGLDASNTVEKYCNEVAGEFLLPESDMLTLQWKGTTLEDIVLAISSFADTRRVSRAMVAYRLLRVGRISEKAWEQIKSHFATQWAQTKQGDAEKQKAAEGGPNYYAVRRHRIGQALMGLVRRSLDDGNTTYTKASRVLGVKPRNVESLLAHLRGAK